MDFAAPELGIRKAWRAINISSLRHEFQDLRSRWAQQSLDFAVSFIRRYQSLNPLLRSRDFVDLGFQCGKFPKRSRIPATIIMRDALELAV